MMWDFFFAVLSVLLATALCVSVMFFFVRIEEEKRNEQSKN